MKAEMLILGVLHRGNFHPYEIKRRLTNAMVECFTDVDVGTLYYAVRRLAKDDLIEALSHERVTRGGTRTVYRITPRGRARFRHLLHAQFEAPGPVSQTLYAAMLFLHLADLSVIGPLLRSKLERQTDLIAKTRTLREQLAAVLSTGGTFLLEHIEAQRRLDHKWLGQVLAAVEAGRVVDVPDAGRLGKAGG